MPSSSTNIVLATTNKGKIREISALLAEFPVHIIGLDAFPQIGEIEENGLTFEENALIKARTVAKKTDHICIADDSGLIVEALGNKPGIYSARYGSDWEFLPGETKDERNIRKLLHDMQNIKNRNCKFATAMAAVSPDGHEMTAHGFWHGKLLEKPLGHNGFGYDPVFFDPALGKTAAQLSAAEKNAHSHRAQALHNLLKGWTDFMRKCGL